jgi:hypothetical protein
MPVANTLSNISKRGFGGFLPTSTNGVWVPASSFSPSAGTVGYFTGCALTAEGARQFALPAHSTISSSLIYRSTDFGTTFAGLSLDGQEWSRVACNYNGQYVLATRLNRVFVSQDFGESYTNRWAPGGADFKLKSVAVSSSGQFMMACNEPYWLLSTNYGSSFTQLSIPLFEPRAVAIAGDTGVLYAAGPYDYPTGAGRIYRSTDGGGSWSVIYAQASIPTYYDLAVSDDGVNITAIFEAETLVSSNSGADFVFRLALSNPGGGGNSHAIAMSGSGMRQLIGVSPFLGYPDNPSYSGIWMSADGGINWTFENLTLRWIGQVGVSKDGRVQMVAGRTQSMGPLPWPASMLYINVQ